MSIALLEQDPQFSSFVSTARQSGINVDRFLIGAHKLDKPTLRRRLRAQIGRMPGIEALIATLNEQSVPEQRMDRMIEELSSVRSLVESLQVKPTRKIIRHGTDDKGFFTVVEEE